MSGKKKASQPLPVDAVKPPPPPSPPTRKMCAGVSISIDGVIYELSGNFDLQEDIAPPNNTPGTEALSPSTALLAKLGSIAVHADEFLSADGHEYDLTALRALLEDQEVKRWVSMMSAMSFVPRKRRA